jgi:hypothetical protein
MSLSSVEDGDLSWWHCYASAVTPSREPARILAADVEARSPEQAAEIAAAQYSYSGIWTVIPGKAVKISVRSNVTYSAQRV